MTSFDPYKPSKSVMRSLRKLYPNLNEKELLFEIKAFDAVFIGGEIIGEMSSNYHKYLRGWLTKANEDKNNHMIKIN